MKIKPIEQNQLEECLELIHVCFKTVADKLGFTQENCPGHTSFMPLEKLQRFWDWGFLMFGLFDEQEKLCGYVSLSKNPERENVFSIHNLCVLPELRKNGMEKCSLILQNKNQKNLAQKSCL